MYYFNTSFTVDNHVILTYGTGHIFFFKEIVCGGGTVSTS
jgi:hypothetical protein